MNPITSVFVDLSTLSLLLLIGFLLRKHVGIFQRLYLPASLLAGFVGLLLGPQVLGKYTAYCLPLTKTIGQWPGVLVTVVLGLSFFGSQSSHNFGRVALSAVTQGGLMHQTQVLVGMGCTLLMMPHFANLPFAFGLTPVFGFHGGHGTANAAGAALSAAGWADGVAVANTMATAGLLSGIILGMIVINIGVRRGWAQKVSKPQDIPQDIREGYVPVEKRTSIGKGVTYNDALDPLALQLAFVGIIYGSARLLSRSLIWVHPLLKEIPLFACAMMCGALLSFIMKKMKMADYIDRPTVNRISGVALDYLVCSAIATLSLKVFALYMVPMLVTIAAVIVANLFVNFYFARKMFDVDWFERAMGAYGLESGVLATGLMLLRVIDPKFETTGQESAAASAALCYPWSLPYIMFMPMLAFKVSPWILFAGSAALWVVFFIIARVFFWNKKTPETAQ
ncbi:MAG: hypothetical protein IJ233_08695 [Pyramidobacter sp.]|nr:hypothetical protein [Pyramidobacter sp.]